MSIVKSGLIQLLDCDGNDAAIFAFDSEKLEVSEAIEFIEEALEESRDEDNPLDAAEELLEQKGIERVYITEYANTSVI